MRGLRVLVWTGVAFMGVTLAAALLAPRMINTTAAREAVSGHLQAALGREVAIRGGLHFTLIPHVGFVCEDIQVAEAGGFSQGVAMGLKRAVVALRARPLLRRRIVFRRIRIEAIEARLVRDAAGRTNWDDLFAPAHRTAPRSGDGRGALLPSFQQVALDDGTLRVEDAASGLGLVFSAVRLRVDGDGHRRFDLNARIGCPRSKVSGLEGLTAHLRLAGGLQVAPDLSALAIADGALDVSLFRTGQPAATLAGLVAEVHADSSRGRVRLENLRLHSAAASLQGRIEGRQSSAGPALNGRLALNIPEMSALLEHLHVAQGASRGLTLPPSMALEAALDAQGGKLRLERLHGHIDKIPLDGSLEFSAGPPAHCQAVLKTAVLPRLPTRPMVCSAISRP